MAQRRGGRVQPPDMGRKRHPDAAPCGSATADDGTGKDAFLRAVAGVKPLPAAAPPPRPAPPPPIPVQSHLDDAAVLDELMHPLGDDLLLENGEEWIYLQDGLPRALLRDLRRGRFRIQENLDLHGCSVDEARQAIGEFLLEARRWRWRCVRIIHGKGLGSPGRVPVLKRMVGQWLIRRKEVLAFAQARPQEGGGGAVIVLLQWPGRHFA